MNLAFIVLLIGASVLFTLVFLCIFNYIKTKLITLLFFTSFPFLFGIAMVSRMLLVISATPLPYLYPIVILCYVYGAMLLVVFIDLISEGQITWKSCIFIFYAGCLTISQLFLDEFTITHTSYGWIVIPKNLLHIGAWVMYVFLSVFIMLGSYLIKIYKKHTGERKKVLKKITIVFFITGFGTMVFNVFGMFHIFDNPVINNLDSICMAFGFGYLIRVYTKSPATFHLDMVDVKLLGVFVYERMSGMLLYNYEFEALKLEKKQLMGGLFKGIDTVIKIILESDQPLKQVIHGSNYIIFNEGDDVMVGLLANVSTLMTSNWLYQFRVEFEKNFKPEIEKFKKSSILSFGDSPDYLIKTIFHQE